MSKDGIEIGNLPPNIHYKKSTGYYIYQKRFRGKRYEWSRKNIEDILKVKSIVETSIDRYDSIPNIKDPQANIDYQNLLTPGARFGEWTVISLKKQNGWYYADCRCSCGVVKSVYAPTLVKGQSKSCGCVFNQRAATKEYQKHAHDIQNSKTTPHRDNKLKIRHISPKRNGYVVSVTRNGIEVRQYFYKLDEAIDFRDKLLQDIKNNDGKIPQFYKKIKKYDTIFSRPATKEPKAVINGKIYYTFTEIARDFGVTHQAISLRYKKGLRNNDLVNGVTVGKRGRKKSVSGKKKKIAKGFPQTIFGKIYNHPDEVAKDFGLSAVTIRTRLHRGYQGDDLAKPKQHNHKLGRTITVDGVTYPSIKALAKAHGLSYELVNLRYHVYKKRGKDLIKPVQKSYTPQIIDGVTYPSFKSISEAFGINDMTLRSRYKSGLRNEQLIKPLKQRRQKNEI